MGFRFRRSVRLMPGVRLNLSKSGASVSLGGRGATVNIGPKGTRTTLGIPGTGLSWSEYSPYKTSSASGPGSSNSLPSTLVETTPLVPITSAPPDIVGAMSTSELAPILTEVSRKVALAPFIIAAGALAFLVSRGEWTAGPLLVGTAALTAIAFALDRYRRSVAIEYEPSGIAAEAAAALGQAFESLRASDRIWRVEARGSTSDWKRNAGATTLNKRSLVYLALGRPRSIRSAASFPSLTFGHQQLYLLPDAALFVDRKAVTALHYRDLEVSQQNVNFIEDERVPKDTLIVSNTWRFVNKNGGPDRRFNNNRQLPVCLYNQLDLTSAGGLNGRLQLSAPDAGVTFVKVLETLARFLDTDASLKPVKSYRRPASWPTAVFISFSSAFLLSVVLLGAQPSGHQGGSFAPPEAAPPATKVPPPAANTSAIAKPTVKDVDHSSTGPLVIVPSLNDSSSNSSVPLPRLRPRNSAPSSLNAPMVLQPWQ